MKRNVIDKGLTALLAIGVLAACRGGTCCPTWSGCCAQATATTAPIAKQKPTWRDKRVKDLRWEETNLDEAVTYLTTLTGKSFVISPKTREEKFDDIVFNLALEDVTVKALLDVMTAPFGLRWAERENVVWILTHEEVSGPLRLRYYDIKDLVEVPPEEPPGKPREEVLSADQMTAILHDLKQEVYPDYWGTEGGGVIEQRNGILIVRASKIVHDALEKQLTRIRQRAGN